MSRTSQVSRGSLALAIASLLAAVALSGCGGAARGASAPSASSGARRSSAAGSYAGSLAAASYATGDAAGRTPFLAGLVRDSSLASTVPADGDVNPYGVAVLTGSVGRLRAGSILVSNFNDSANEQGTGTTIEEIARTGARSLFAHLTASQLPGRCPGGVGLTTALAVLQSGYVVVGSLPTTDGMSATAQAGCLIVLDSEGRPVETIAGGQLQGPWDMTAVTHGTLTTLFVSDALSGGARAGTHTIDNSTVLRIRLRTSAGRPPVVLGEQVVADGIPWRNDPEALVIGPTGLVLAGDGTLYLADALANRITAIPAALTRSSAVAVVARRSPRAASFTSRSAWRSRPTATCWRATRATVTSSRSRRRERSCSLAGRIRAARRGRCSAWRSHRTVRACCSSTTPRTPCASCAAERLARRRVGGARHPARAAPLSGSHAGALAVHLGPLERYSCEPQMGL